MVNLLFTMLIVYSVIEILMLKRVEKFLFKIKHTSENLEEEGEVKIVVVIPVFKEQSIIIESIDWMDKLNYIGKEIIYVGTEFEGGTLNTIKKGEKYVKRGNLRGISFIEAPKNIYGKAKQLNYAINSYKCKDKQSKRTYFCFFDADSRPHKEVLNELQKSIIINKFPVAIQIPSLYTKNYRDVTCYAKWESVYQQKRVFLNEIYAQYKTLTNKYIYTYMVGHGMCLEKDFLIKTKKFSEPFDDVSMGQRLRMMGIPIIPMKIFDYADVALSLNDIFKQSGGWFLGGLVYREYLRNKRLGINLPIDTKLNILFRGVLDNCSWFFYGILVFAGIFCMEEKILFIVWILSQAATLYVTDRLCNKIELFNNIPEHGYLKKIEYVIAAVIRPVIRASVLFSCILIFIKRGKIEKTRRVEDCKNEASYRHYRRKIWNRINKSNTRDSK